MVGTFMLAGCANGKGPNLPPREVYHPPTTNEIKSDWVVKRPPDAAKANLKALLTSFPAYSDVVERGNSISANFHSDEAHQYVDCGSVQLTYVDKAGQDQSGTVKITQNGSRVINSWVDLVYGVGYVTEIRTAVVDGSLKVTLSPGPADTTELSITVVHDTTVDLAYTLNQPLDDRMGYPLKKTEHLQASSFARPGQRCRSTMRLEGVIAAYAEGRKP